MTNRDELRTMLTRQRDEYARVGALVSGAIVLDDVLARLESLWGAEDDAELSLDEAAARTGLSGRTLRRRVQSGVLPASRRGKRLYFRRADLPAGGPVLAPPAKGSYDPVADARQVASRRNHGDPPHGAS